MTVLSEYFRSQANWRWQKAQEYPDDYRNEQSSKALSSLADFVEEHPEEVTPWVLETLESHWCIAAPDVASPGEEASRVVSRYGFGYSAVDHMQHIEFLEDLAPLAVADTYEVVRDTGHSDEDRSDEHLAELAGHFGLTMSEVEAALDGVFLDPRYFERRSHLAEHEQDEWIAACREEDADD